MFPTKFFLSQLQPAKAIWRSKYGAEATCPLNEDILFKWLAVIIVLSLYQVSIEEAFTSEEPNFNVKRLMSQQTFRRITTCLTAIWNSGKLVDMENASGVVPAGKFLIKKKKQFRNLYYI